MQERVDIRDVARTAGVSITTVSNAISGKGRLSPETRERVRRIAEQMGYEPSVHARGLVTGETRLLAIQASGFDDKSLIPQVAYIQELINSAAQTSLELGYSLVVVPPNSSEILDHLWDEGARQPALLTTASKASYARDVVEAYRTWCREVGIRKQVIRIRRKPTVDAGAIATAKALTSAGPPDAVFATLETLAVGALQGVQLAAKKVPDDILIAALTDGDLLRYALTPVTALDLHPAETGRRMIQILVGARREQDGAGQPESVFLKPKIHRRRSSQRRSSSR